MLSNLVSATNMAVMLFFALCSTCCALIKINGGNQSVWQLTDRIGFISPVISHLVGDKFSRGAIMVFRLQVWQILRGYTPTTSKRKQCQGHLAWAAVIVTWYGWSQSSACLDPNRIKETRCLPDGQFRKL